MSPTEIIGVRGRSPRPVEAPAGAIARPRAPPASVTSASTVGRPRESQTRRAQHESEAPALKRQRSECN